MVARLFIYHNMKRFLLTTALTTAGFISVNGQFSEGFDDIDFVPSAFTTDGKGAIIGINEHSAKVLDGDMNVVRQFNLKTTTYYSRDYSEVATIMPSGAELNENSYRRSVLTHNEEVVTATDLASMKQKLKSIYGESCEFYNFTDSKGNLSLWSPNLYLSSFYHQEWFGTMYPEYYFSLIDGEVYEVRVYYKAVVSQNDIDRAEWKYESGDAEGQTHVDGPENKKFNDFDLNSLPDNSFTLTQSLFNDDDKWEYILPKYGQVTKRTGELWEGPSNANGIEFSRSVSESQETIGYSVYNEDGTEIATLNMTGDIDIVARIGGNVYIMTYNDGDDVLYRYDPNDTQVREINRSESKAARIAMNGRTITIDTGGQKVDEAVLFNMSGQKVSSGNAHSNGSITLDTAGMRSGVYSVSVKSQGRTVGSQKIMLK